MLPNQPAFPHPSQPKPLINRPATPRSRQPLWACPKTPRIERINNMANNYGNGGGYPSTTGNPSGGGRSNGPRGK